MDLDSSASKSQNGLIKLSAKEVWKMDDQPSYVLSYHRNCPLLGLIVALVGLGALMKCYAISLCTVDP